MRELLSLTDDIIVSIGIFVLLPCDFRSQTNGKNLLMKMSSFFIVVFI